MAEWPDLLARTYDAVRGPVALLEEPLLDRRTPCSEWAVRDLFQHVLGTMNGFAAAIGAPAIGAPAGGEPGGGEPGRGGPAGARPVEQFDAAADRSVAAWRSVTDPTTTVTLPFATLPAGLVVAMNQLDVLVHGWDLAAALGVGFSMPEQLAAAALATAEVRCRQVPRSPVWGPELPPRGDSTQEKLLALTGRDTSGWPGAIWVAGSLVTVKPTSGDAGRASGVEIWEREGSGPPRHVHADHDELWYVLEGRFTFALGDREFEADAGQVVVGPRGVPHTFRAETPNSRLLDVHMPGGFERFFVQAGRPATALVPPQTDPTPVPQLVATIESFGAAVVGPPLGH